MHILSTMINALAAFYPNVDLLSMDEDIELSTARLISMVRTMAAMAYKKSIGEPVVYPRHDLSYCANFLNMMFDSPVAPYKISPEAVRILNILLILHADHEQNCSTTTVRTIGSAQVNLYATISAGISALSGPLHGGANQEVVEMLRHIQENGDVKKYVDQVKDKKNTQRLMGFGHRVYKTFDPRARIIKKECHDFLRKMNISDPLLDVALEVEEVALHDDYFISRHLYPNVDFYSGIVYRALGIPENMFTVMFALARLPGWIAHWKEMIGANTKIVRPHNFLLHSFQECFSRFNAENIIFDIQFCRLFRRIIGCKPSCTVRQYRKESHDGFLRNDTDLFELGSGRGKGCHAEIFASCGILFHCRSFCIGGAGLYFFFRTALPVGKNQLEIRTAWG